MDFLTSTVDHYNSSKTLFQVWWGKQEKWKKIFKWLMITAAMNGLILAYICFWKPIFGRKLQRHFCLPGITLNPFALWERRHSWIEFFAVSFVLDM